MQENLINHNLKTVTQVDDSGEGSLRSAIAQANSSEGKDTITFDQSLSGETINLTSGQLEITDDLIINGLGPTELTINGNENSRIFQINDGNDETQIEVAIKGLTVKDGEAIATTPGEIERGGAILNQEELSLSNSRISNNSANFGGGIANNGSFTITNTRVANNRSSGPPGVVDAAAKAGIDNDGSMILVNSTVSDHGAAGAAGIGNDGMLTLS